MKKKIVFLSHTSRNSIYKVGSYHLSNYLSKEYDVLYVSPPLSVFHFVKALVNKSYRENIFKKKIDNLKIKKENNITTFTPFVLIPYRAVKLLDYSIIPLKFSKYSTQNIRKKIKNLGFSEVEYVFQDSLVLSFMSEFIESKKWIYRVTDDYITMPNQPNSLKEVERKIVEKSSNVVVTSKVLRKLFKKRYGIDSFVIENGVDVNLFRNQKLFYPMEYKSCESKIKCIYIGSIDDRFDYNLVNSLAKENPEVYFYFIGPLSDKINNNNNVFKLGVRDISEIGKYMEYADIGILPFDISHKGNETRSPMKIYEYAYFKLEIFSSNISEINSRQHDFVNIGESNKDFLIKFNNYVSKELKCNIKAKEVALSMSWEKKSNELMELIG